MSDWPPFLAAPLWVWLFVMPLMLAAVARFTRRRIRPLLTPLWRVCDCVYLGSGIVAAVFMVAILLIIICQMVARWSGATFEGSTEFAGYAMAATSFFALAHALSRGSHIRVSIFLNLNAYTRLWLDAFALMVGAIIATYFARYAVKANFLSAVLNDRTQGQDQIPEWVLSVIRLCGTWPDEWGKLLAQTGSEWLYTPLWLPQLPMSIGTILLAVALWDNLIRLLVNGVSAITTDVVK